MLDFEIRWQSSANEYVYHIIPEELGAEAVKKGELEFGDPLSPPNCYLFTNRLEYNDGTPVVWHPDFPIPPKAWCAGNRFDPGARDLSLEDGWLMVVRVRLTDIQLRYGNAFQKFQPAPDTEHPYDLYGLISDLNFAAVNAEFFEFYDPSLWVQSYRGLGNA